MHARHAGVLYSSIKSLTLENITLSSLMTIVPPEITQLHLKAVNIKNIDANFSVAYDENSIVRITDSYFGSIKHGRFVFSVSKVQIQRNHFKELGYTAFSGMATDSFIMTDNLIERTSIPFEVRSSNIQFINNTVIASSHSFLSNFEMYSESSSLTFNFSQNSLGFVPKFLLKTPSFPENVLIQNNRFNCSCGSVFLASPAMIQSPLEKIFTEILKVKENNNVCGNYENCGVSKFLNKNFDACLKKFECPVNDVEIEDKQTFVKSSMKSVLNYLSEISDKLSILGNMINSTIEERSHGLMLSN